MWPGVRRASGAAGAALVPVRLNSAANQANRADNRAGGQPDVRLPDHVVKMLRRWLDEAVRAKPNQAYDYAALFSQIATSASNTASTD